MIKNLLQLLKITFKEWNADDPFRQSAVIAYYAIFSLPGLLVVLVTLTGIFFGQEVVTGKIADEITATMGPDTSGLIQEMVSNTFLHDKNILALAIGVLVILFGATSVFAQLQKTLNYIWEVRAKSSAGIMKMVMDRVFSLGLVLSIGFLLLISLAMTTALSAASDWIQSYLPEALVYVFHAVNFLFILGVITVLFALIFKILPDAVVKWSDVWLGAFLSALLFVIAKFALAFYFGQADPGGAYGAAGSVILILLWVSYSCMILFFGAEFTKQYATKFGEEIVPKEHAERLPKECNPV